MEQTERKKKNVGLMIVLLVGISAIIVFIQFFKTPSFDKEMVQSSSEINKTLPIMLDQETRLDNTMALPDRVFQYSFTLVNMVKDSIDMTELQGSLETKILNNVKTNPDQKHLRDNNTTMVYSYKDQNGVFLFKIIITPNQYKE